ncbi:MAG: extracellular solute-binding protein, partial [Oscillospiraceae bacterium]|nr:extracellular solute-binding protein [Oscillospiraceae bacterium]
MKKILALILTAALLASLSAGCRRENTDAGDNIAPPSDKPTATARLAYAPDFIAPPIPTGAQGKLSRISSLTAARDKVYLLAHFTTPDGEVTTPYSMNADGSGLAPLLDYEAPEDSDAKALCVSNDGGVIVAELAYSEDGDKPEVAVYLRTLDDTGAETERRDISEEIGYSRETGVNIGKIETDGAGNIYILDPFFGVNVYLAESGEFFSLRKGEDEYIGSFVKLRDGSVAVTVMYTGNMLGNFIASVDVEARQLGARRPAPAAVCSGDERYDYYTLGLLDFCGYNLDAGASEDVFSEKIFSLAGVGIPSMWGGGDSQGITSVVALGGGVFVCAFVSGSGDGAKAELALLSQKEIDAELGRIQLTLASSGSLWPGDAALVERFNREHPEYEIVVTSYAGLYNSDGTPNYDELNRFNLDIISGKTPDIILLNPWFDLYTYTSKGVFEDLYPYLDRDAELGGRGAVLPEILRTLETDGALYQIFSGFIVTTYAAPRSVVGDKDNWTVDEALEMLKAHPGASVFANTTADSLLEYILLYGADDFVNWETGECFFDSEAFIKQLEFANSAPKTKLDVLNMPPAADLVADGKALAMGAYVANFENVRTTYEALGGDFAYIGFPGASGNGGAFYSFGQPISMSAKSEHKDAAWAFIRMFLTEEYQIEQSGEAAFLSTLPTNKAAFDALAERKTQSETDPLTPEEIDVIKALIAGVDKWQRNDVNLWAIISEEASPYFAGQRT